MWSRLCNACFGPLGEGETKRTCEACRAAHRARRSRLLQKRLAAASAGACICLHCGRRDNVPAGRKWCVVCLAYYNNYSRAIRSTVREWFHTPCAGCGDDRLCHLEFAHRDPEQKTIEFSDITTLSRARRELKNARSLCMLCHALETVVIEGRGRKSAMGKAERAREALVASVLFGKYDGRCQCGMAGCTFRITPESPAWVARCMEWDHQDGRTKVANIAKLRKSGKIGALRLELAKCVPLFRPHHQLVTKHRRECDPSYTIQAGSAKFECAKCLAFYEKRTASSAPPLGFESEGDGHDFAGCAAVERQTFDEAYVAFLERNIRRSKFQPRDGQVGAGGDGQLAESGGGHGSEGAAVEAAQDGGRHDGDEHPDDAAAPSISAALWLGETGSGCVHHEEDAARCGAEVPLDLGFLAPPAGAGDAQLAAV